MLVPYRAVSLPQNPSPLASAQFFKGAFMSMISAKLSHDSVSPALTFREIKAQTGSRALHKVILVKASNRVGQQNGLEALCLVVIASSHPPEGPVGESPF